MLAFHSSSLNDINKMTIYYSDISSDEISKKLLTTTLFIPIGTIEQHGPHLPLSVDVDIPVSITQKLATEMAGLIAPAIHYGARSLPQSGGGSSFPGTISVKGEVLIGYYREIFLSYLMTGAKDIVIINGHYENEPFIFEALEQCREKERLTAKVIALSWWSVINDKLINSLFDGIFPGWSAEHAGLVETSLMLFLYPNKVKDVRLNHDKPPLAGVYIHPINPTAISNQGILAKTSGSSAKIGEILFNEICQALKELLNKPHGLLETLSIA